MAAIILSRRYSLKAWQTGGDHVFRGILTGIPRLAQIIEGVVFKDGAREDVENIAA